MDKLQHYRDIIRQILTEQAQPYNHSSDVEAEVIFDTEHDSPIGDATRTISTYLCRLAGMETHF